MAHRLLLHAWLIACCMRQWARRFSDFNVRILATLNPAQSPPLTGLVAPCPLYIMYVELLLADSGTFGVLGETRL